MTVENDKKIFAARYPAIVPFLMEEYRGNVEFEVYSGVKKLAEAFQKDFDGRWFSEKALRYISSALDPYIEKNGYERDKKGAALYYNSYELRDAAQVNTALVQASTYRLGDVYREGMKNLTTFSLCELQEKEIEAFVTLLDGAVVAIATVNEKSEEGGMLEITVETAVAHRGKGYALSNVAALCDYLTKHDVALAYCCRNTHSKSNKIARHVGFTKVGRFYAVSAYRMSKQTTRQDNIAKKG